MHAFANAHQYTLAQRQLYRKPNDMEENPTQQYLKISAIITVIQKQMCISIIGWCMSKRKRKILTWKPDIKSSAPWLLCAPASTDSALANISSKSKSPESKFGLITSPSAAFALSCSSFWKRSSAPNLIRRNQFLVAFRQNMDLVFYL